MYEIKLDDIIEVVNLKVAIIARIEELENFISEIKNKKIKTPEATINELKTLKKINKQLEKF